MKLVMFTGADGTAAIVGPMSAVAMARRGIETEDDAVEYQRQREEANGRLNVAIVENPTFPKDRIFRGAWVRDDVGCAVDMPKAREIHMGRIRKVRDKELAALDVETVKAVGRGDDQARAEVETRKQALRDIPQTLDLTKAETPEDLAALWPDGLAR